MEAKKHPSSRRYPPEMKERAVRMVEQTIAESGERWGVVSRIARQLGIGEQTLRNWVERAEIDAGKRPGTSTEDKTRITELETPALDTPAQLRRSTPTPICGPTQKTVHARLSRPNWVRKSAVRPRPSRHIARWSFIEQCAHKSAGRVVFLVLSSCALHPPALVFSIPVMSHLRRKTKSDAVVIEGCAALRPPL
jgi:transposase-like protein